MVFKHDRDCKTSDIIVDEAVNILMLNMPKLTKNDLMKKVY